MKTTRKFGGRIYKLWPVGYRTKRSAEAQAKRFREDGRLARVTQRVVGETKPSIGWVVWYK